MKAGAFGIVLLLFVVLPAFADDRGTTGLPVLSLNCPVRFAAMGHITAPMIGAEGIFANPAGMAMVNSIRFGLSRYNHVQGIDLSGIHAVMPAGHGVAGISYQYLDLGSIDEYSGGIPTGRTLRSWEKGFSIGYAVRPGPGIAAGLAVTMAGTTLVDEFHDSTSALHFGVLWTGRRNGMRAGFAMRNIGHGIDYGTGTSAVPLPTWWGFGVILPFSGQAQSKIHAKAAIELSSWRSGTAVLNLGLAADIKTGDDLSTSVRLGYRGGAQDDSYGGLTGGMGFTFGRIRLDWAMENYVRLGTVQKLSMHWSFEKGAGNTAKPAAQSRTGYQKTKTWRKIPATGKTGRKFTVGKVDVLGDLTDKRYWKLLSILAYHAIALPGAEMVLVPAGDRNSERKIVPGFGLARCRAIRDRLVSSAAKTGVLDLKITTRGRLLRATSLRYPKAMLIVPVVFKGIDVDAAINRQSVVLRSLARIMKAVPELKATILYFLPRGARWADQSKTVKRAEALRLALGAMSKRNKDSISLARRNSRAAKDTLEIILSVPWGYAR